MTTVHDFLRSNATIGDIAAHLDALPADAREAQANDLSGSEQSRLWDLASTAPVITPSHFVPEGLDHTVGVRHPGRNTIPVPRHFQKFAKVFARDDDDPRLVNGYNDSNASFIHPGYFVAYETRGNAEWEKRGGVVVDYLRVPDSKVPPGWPKIVPNTVGLQRFVYNRTRDFMRRVSSHVSIGRAAEQRGQGDRELDFWFTLCRQDPKR